MVSMLALTFAIGCSKDNESELPEVIAAPSNLVVTTTPNNLVLKVKATATDATSFDVYFGVNGETPKNILVGGEASYTYAAAGTYNVKVVAKNTGTETIEKITAVTVTLPTPPPPSGVAPFAPIDFESTGYGATWTWTVFENTINPPALEIVNNPSATGINTSSKVAKFTALDLGEDYAGCESKRNPADIGTFKFDATNKIVRIMVYKTVISDVGLKFSEINGEAQPEVKVANTKINQWEELRFDLSGLIGKGITGNIVQIIIFPDFNARTQDNVIYFDNITFSSN
jgi:PKD repeat protein